MFDKTRTELVRQALRDHDRRRNIREQLAPCTPEQDYDRFEAWSNGFGRRLSRYDMMESMPAGVAGDWADGWRACDRLLYPENH